jgi:hypothetical protein
MSIFSFFSSPAKSKMNRLISTSVPRFNSVAARAVQRRAASTDAAKNLAAGAAGRLQCQYTEYTVDHNHDSG